MWNNKKLSKMKKEGRILEHVFYVLATKGYFQDALALHGYKGKCHGTNTLNINGNHSNIYPWNEKETETERESNWS